MEPQLATQCAHHSVPVRETLFGLCKALAPIVHDGHKRRKEGKKEGRMKEERKEGRKEGRKEIREKKRE